MNKHCKIIDDTTKEVIVGLGEDTEQYILLGMEIKDVEQSDINNNWYLAGYAPMKTEEQKRQEERERISKLKCTKRVLALMLEELGFDYFETIQPLIEANKQAKLEWELCVELERANPLLDVIGQQLGINSAQIDNIFEYANGEITFEEFRGGV